MARSARAGERLSWAEAWWPRREPAVLLSSNLDVWLVLPALVMSLRTFVRITRQCDAEQRRPDEGDEEPVPERHRDHSGGGGAHHGLHPRLDPREEREAGNPGNEAPTSAHETGHAGSRDRPNGDRDCS